MTEPESRLRVVRGQPTDPEPLLRVVRGQPTDPEPLLRVVRGQPTDEEAAAVTVVLTAKLAARPPAAARDRRITGGWADRARAMRTPLTPGPGAWRRSQYA